MTCLFTTFILWSAFAGVGICVLRSGAHQQRRLERAYAMDCKRALRMIGEKIK